LNQLVNNNTSNWSGTFKTTLKEIPGEFIDVSKIKAM